MTVQVFIFDETIRTIPNLTQSYFLSKLREAGIPVKGFFSFQGLEHGRIYTTIDFEKRGVMYTWRDD